MPSIPSLPFGNLFLFRLFLPLFLLLLFSEILVRPSTLSLLFRHPLPFQLLPFGDLWLPNLLQLLSASLSMTVVSLMLQRMLLLLSSHGFFYRQGFMSIQFPGTVLWPQPPLCWQMMTQLLQRRNFIYLEPLPLSMLLSQLPQHSRMISHPPFGAVTMPPPLQPCPHTIVCIDVQWARCTH